MAITKGEYEEEIIKFGSATIQEGVPRYTSDGRLKTDATFTGGISISPYENPPKVTSVSVGTSATALPSTPLSGRKLLILTNNGTQTVYLGDSSVTTSNGLPLLPSSSLIIEAGETCIWYGIVPSGSCDVRVAEVK